MQKLDEYLALENNRKLFDEALIQYLSGDRTAQGYQPIHKEGRLVQKYGADSHIYLALIDEFMGQISEYEPGWKRNESIDEIGEFKGYIGKKYSWLSNSAMNQLGNWFAYQWK